MSKFDTFVTALSALCREHGVQLAVSGYDSLQVWDLEKGDDPIHAAGVEDRTEGARNGCGARLAPGQHWAFCGETDMGQTEPALCTACGGEFTPELR